ncbi:uncharacterized protein LOC111334370 isoform X2 [Stylophora pistillata]|uniref:uncharacterized protein LOC111334370 isoform X2 n=1 Tax=Stylophora pistillata TaxID=50429 RepID=UPI000C04B4AA|nr:uncharacterized protein LOC111334370 isoform X2 [Stylophora pistillata]
MFNANFLKKAAISGAVLSIAGAAFFHHKIQANIASQDYYKTSVQLLRDHQLALDTLGEPLRITYMNLSCKDIMINHEIAQVVIPVRGSNSKGNLYSFATRTEDNGFFDLSEASS